MFELTEKSASAFSYTSNALQVLLGLVLAVIGVVSWWSSIQRDQHAQKKELANVQAIEDSQQKQQMLADALVQANLKLEQALKMASESAVKLKPRSISESQKDEFHRLLKAEPLGNILVSVLSTDTEAVSYANQLCEMLQAIGHQARVGGYIGFSSTGKNAPEGLLLLVGGGEVPVYADSISRALELVGIEFETARDLGIAPDMMQIRVGPKPVVKD